MLHKTASHMARHACIQHSLISNRPTTPSLVTIYGTIYISVSFLFNYSVFSKYHNDDYTLVDGDKQAYVRPTYGVQQRCPLSPFLFSIYLNDINEISEVKELALAHLISMYPNFYTLMTYA
eukprot:1160762-Pelagomonas_calceolata.AAC.7